MALEHEALTERIIGAAIEVHRRLGPGFLESVYEKALIIDRQNNPGAQARDGCLSESVPAFLPSSFTLSEDPRAQQIQYVLISRKCENYLRLSSAHADRQDE